MQIGNTSAAAIAANQAPAAAASPAPAATLPENTAGSTDTKVTLSKEALELLAGEKATSEIPPTPVMTPFNGGGTEPPDPP